MRVFLVAAAAFVLVVPTARTQQQTIRSESRLVLVDSIVTDKKGAYIQDLTQKDFKIWEDGREQTLSAFSFQRDPALASNEQKHHLVLYFDNSTVAVENQGPAREAATKFIQSNAGPGRLISIAEFNGALEVTQDFTGEADRLERAVNGTRLSARVRAAASSDVSPAGTNAGINTGINTVAYSPRAAQNALHDLALGLAKIPGRKIVVLLSGGFTSTPQQLDALIDACNRANVSLYPVGLGRGNAGGISSDDLSSGVDASGASRSQGLPPVANRRSQSTSAARDDTNVRSANEVLTALASGTGGFLTAHTNDLPGGLERIGKEQSESYTLGYIPALESAKALKPGTCHTIKVKVDRSGANIRYRTGYCDAKNADVLSGTPTQRELEARLAANATPTVEASIQTPFFYISANTARVDVAVDIPGGGIKFVPDKGKFESTLNVIGIAYLPDGGVSARFSDSVRLTLNGKKQLDEFASKPYHYEKQFEVASGKFDLKLIFSSGADDFGKVEAPLTVEEWNPSKFSLSALALSKSVHPAGSEPDSNNIPLVVNGIQVTPAGNNHFRNSDTGFIYAEVYEPAIPLPALGVHMVLLDAKNQSIAKDMGVSPLKAQALPGSQAVPIGLILPLADLPIGSYIAQVTALDATGSQATRSVGFELEQ